MEFLLYLITGTSLGSVYAVIALGYTMVYGIAKMLNFAHGDIIMVGAYASYYLLTSFGVNIVLSIIITMIVCALLGVTIEKLAYKPLRKASSLSVLITAIGVSYFLQNIVQIICGSNAVVYPNLSSNKQIVLFDGQLSIPLLTIITIAICLAIMFGLLLFVNKTKIGKAMRAASEDKDAASLMGVNVDGTISITFAIGCALAAIASILLCSTYPSIYPTMGSMPGIKAFTASVFGGIGSIEGALLGGVLLGIIETLTKAYISTQLSDAIVFTVLIIVLLIKPTGLLGKKVNEKV